MLSHRCFLTAANTSQHKVNMLYHRYTMTPERSRALWRMSERVFAKACDALEYLHDSLCVREKKNAKLLVSRGALPTSVQAAYEEQKQQCGPMLGH